MNNTYFLTVAFNSTITFNLKVDVERLGLFSKDINDRSIAYIAHNITRRLYRRCSIFCNIDLVVLYVEDDDDLVVYDYKIDRNIKESVTDLMLLNNDLLAEDCEEQPIFSIVKDRIFEIISDTLEAADIC